MSFIRKRNNGEGAPSALISTDFHSHILPCIDDGSESVEKSLEMLELSYSQGVRTVIATPHFYPQYQKLERFLEKRAQCVALLKEAMEKGMNEGKEYPTVLVGAEVAYFHGISRCEVLDELCVEDTRLVLVEMPFQKWDDRIINEMLEIKRNLDLIPVVAHIDRYASGQSGKMLERLFCEDLLIQANAESFIKKTSRRRMLKLVQGDMIDFVGSDCHNMSTRHPNMGEASKIICESLGDGAIEKINDFGNFVFLGE